MLSSLVSSNGLWACRLPRWSWWGVEPRADLGCHCVGLPTQESGAQSQGGLNNGVGCGGGISGVYFMFLSFYRWRQLVSVLGGRSLRGQGTIPRPRTAERPKEEGTGPTANTDALPAGGRAGSNLAETPSLAEIPTHPGTATIPGERIPKPTTPGHSKPTLHLHTGPDYSPTTTDTCSETPSLTQESIRRTVLPYGPDESPQPTKHTHHDKNQFGTAFDSKGNLTLGLPAL